MTKTKKAQVLASRTDGQNPLTLNPRVSDLNTP